MEFWKEIEELELSLTGLHMTLVVFLVNLTKTEEDSDTDSIIQI